MIPTQATVCRYSTVGWCQEAYLEIRVTVVWFISASVSNYYDHLWCLDTVGWVAEGDKGCRKLNVTVI